MNEHDYALRDAAMAEFVDSYFKARPQLLRTRHEECLVEAGFKAAWKPDQTERAEKAEAELAKLREQTAVAQVEVAHGFHKRTTNWLKSLPDGTHLLFTGPVAAPAVLAVPDGDDFNGSTPHLIQCMEALVRLDADGVLVPHGIGRDASKLLSAAANRLRQQAASSVPEEWRKVMAELADDLAIEIDQDYPPERRVYLSEQRRYEGEMEIVNRARALLQSAEVRHD